MGLLAMHRGRKRPPLGFVFGAKLAKRNATRPCLPVQDAQGMLNYSILEKQDLI